MFVPLRLAPSRPTTVPGLGWSGAALRSERTLSGFTQAKVAGALGVSQGKYSNLENDASDPSPEQLRVLAAMFGRADWLPLPGGPPKGDAEEPEDYSPEALVRELDRRGWSHQRLASAARVSQQSVSRYAEGSSWPRPGPLLRMAVALERFDWIEGRFDLDPRDCPSCGESGHVIDSRPGPAYRRRRRGCKACGERWTTYEVAELAASFPYRNEALGSLRSLLSSARRLASILELIAPEGGDVG